MDGTECKTLRSGLNPRLGVTRDTTADCIEAHRCLAQSRAYWLGVEFRKCVWHLAGGLIGPLSYQRIEQFH